MIADWLSLAYPWVKVLHVVSVISWMAGLFYLPRLFVHHTESVTVGSETDSLFQKMELKLLRVIMNPAMISTWVFGVLLACTPGVVDWWAVWPYAKGVGILSLTWFHHWLGRRRTEFAEGRNWHSGRTYRLMNEVPTVLMIVIVVAIIARPF